MPGVHKAINVTSFTSLVFGFKRYAKPKTINFKAARYGGVKFKT